MSNKSNNTNNNTNNNSTNVKVVVRVRPISANHESAWNIPSDAPHQIQLFDVKGKLSTTYGVGRYLMHYI